RFNLTNGLGDSVFVHDAVAGDLNATFVRRDISAFVVDRRLAELGSVFTELDVVGFSVEWTPLGGAPTAFPLIGFFDSTTMAGIAVLAVTDNRYQLEIGKGQPDSFHVEDTGFNYAVNETYLIELLLDGPSGTVSVSSSILQGGGFVSQGTNSWNFGTSYAFDTLGVGNILDDQGFGATFSADFDNFSFVPEPGTAILLLLSGALCLRRLPAI
ncbi:MAG: PEP-CTERM sorting domain-containing protein, partial [Gemmatimonadetes bacterium]|nr:PEP-CTERM sorting domain-containing protein [Gemmatimonadota bacterium]